MPPDIKEAAAGGDKIAGMLVLAHKLGGWVILAIAASFALKYVWDERVSSNQELIKELRSGKDQTLMVISQNAQALQKSSDSQEKVATAIEALTIEVRRNQP